MTVMFSRAVGPIPVDCVLTEKHSATIEITGNPIETGAEVNDHAYVKPKQVTLEIADSNAALMYNILVRFQESRVPFYMITGLMVYKDMLIQSIDATRDKDMSTVLRATVICRQVIIVSTASAPAGGSGASSSQQGNPGGKKSQKATNPSTQSSNNPSTANRASQPVQRGDSPTKSVPSSQNSSLLKRALG